MTISAEDRALRVELSEARFVIQHQLEVLRSPIRGGRLENREIIARLQQQLAEIEEALADLEGDA